MEVIDFELEVAEVSIAEGLAFNEVSRASVAPGILLLSALLLSG